jgi:8-oxo-dGTP diphosphatase
VPKGFDQAAAIADQLAGDPISRVLSSPSLRCRQTVGPLAGILGVTIEVCDVLDEGQRPAAALELIDAFAADGTDAVLCSHGDVIPEVLAKLSRRHVELSEPRVCAKGSIWRLAVRDGSVTGGTYLHPG